MPVESLQQTVRQETQRNLERIDIAILEYIEQAPREVSIEDVDRDVHAPSADRMGQFIAGGLIRSMREGSGTYVLTMKCAAVLNELRNRYGVEELAEHWRRGDHPRPRGEHASPADDELDIVEVPPVGSAEEEGAQGDVRGKVLADAKPEITDSFPDVDDDDDEDEDAQGYGGAGAEKRPAPKDDGDAAIDAAIGRVKRGGVKTPKTPKAAARVKSRSTSASARRGPATPPQP